MMNGLIDKGYCVVQCKGPEDYFYKSKNLGDVWFEADIKLKQNSKYGAHSFKELGFHTDAPTANIVGWYAVTPGAPTLLKDMASLDIDDGTLDALRWIFCTCPSTDRESFTRHPIFDSIQTRSRFYYAPWFVNRVNIDSKSREALDVFEKAIDKLEVISITIPKDSALYVDNGRMLHGRSSLDPGSPRHLRRHWINVRKI